MEPAKAGKRGQQRSAGQARGQSPPAALEASGSRRRRTLGAGGQLASSRATNGRSPGPAAAPRPPPPGPTTPPSPRRSTRYPGPASSRASRPGRFRATLAAGRQAGGGRGVDGGGEAEDRAGQQRPGKAAGAGPRRADAEDQVPSSVGAVAPTSRRSGSSGAHGTARARRNVPPSAASVWWAVAQLPQRNRDVVAGQAVGALPDGCLFRFQAGQYPGALGAGRRGVLGGVHAFQHRLRCQVAGALASTASFSSSSATTNRSPLRSARARARPTGREPARRPALSAWRSSASSAAPGCAAATCSARAGDARTRCSGNGAASHAPGGLLGEQEVLDVFGQHAQPGRGLGEYAAARDPPRPGRRVRPAEGHAARPGSGTIGSRAAARASPCSAAARIRCAPPGSLPISRTAIPAARRRTSERPAARATGGGRVGQGVRQRGGQAPAHCGRGALARLSRASAASPSAVSRSRNSACMPAPPARRSGHCRPPAVQAGELTCGGRRFGVHRCWW